MSLARARMAKTRFLSFVHRTGYVAGFGMVVSCGPLQAQENVFRVASVRLPSVTFAPQQGAPVVDKTAEGQNDSEASENVFRLKAEQSSVTDTEVPQAGTDRDQASSKNREPIVLSPLTVPNTSIPGVGKGSTPEDFVSGRLPSAITLPYGPDRYGFWELGYKTWTAPVYCAQPLYFEDTMLERHGHERVPCLQPLISGARFFTNIAILPYNSYLQRPLEERYSTGHYRSGSAAPGLRQRAPYDAGALRFQLLTTGTSIIAVQP